MKLALFGGTFDPIHSGHIEAATRAADTCVLDRILVVPSGSPPHKQEGCRAGYEHRFRMVELACRADARLAASRLEQPRADGEAHYSVDTISRIRARMEFAGALHLIIGTDAFAEIGLWRDIDQISEWVKFIVVERPGFAADGAVQPSHTVRCSHPASSRAVRHRAKIGGALADLVPAAGCEYIWQHSLYRPQAVGAGDSGQSGDRLTMGP